MCTGDGQFWLDIFDHFVSDYVLILVGLFEVVTVGWVYGAQRLADEYASASGHRIPQMWVYLITYVDPAIIVSMFVYNVYWEAQETYEGYAGWGIAAGWMYTMLAVSWFFIALVVDLPDGHVKVRNGWVGCWDNVCDVCLGEWACRGGGRRF